MCASKSWACLFACVVVVVTSAGVTSPAPVADIAPVSTAKVSAPPVGQHGFPFCVNTERSRTSGARNCQLQPPLAFNAKYAEVRSCELGDFNR